jgi:hypothetical protein
MTCPQQISSIPYLDATGVAQANDALCQSACQSGGIPPINCYASLQGGQGGLAVIQATCSDTPANAANTISASSFQLMTSLGNVCMYGGSPGTYAYTTPYPVTNRS